MPTRTHALLIALGCVLLVGAALTLWPRTATESPPPSSAAPTAASTRPAAGAATGDSRPEADAVRTAIETPSSRPTGLVPGDDPMLRGRLVVAQGTLPPGLRLQFRVSDLSGAVRLPVARLDSLATPVEAMADADGRFALRAPRGLAGKLTLLDQSWVFARGTAEHPRPGVLEVEAHEGDHDLGDIPVTAAASIAGTVRDPSGKPIAGATVRIEWASVDLFELGALAHAKPEADAEGRFALHGLTAGKLRVRAAAAGFVPAQVEVELAEGEHKSGVAIELVPGLAIHGRVVDDTGKPVAGASVIAMRPSAEGSALFESMRGGGVKTDTLGAFVIGGLEEPVVTVLAWAKSHERARQENVGAGAGEVVLRVARCGAIEGVLVDTTGAPIAGSEILARAARGSGSLIDVSLDAQLGHGGNKTGDDGAFRVEDVGPGDVLVHAEGASHLETEAVKVVVPPGATLAGVRLVAKRGGVLAATVRDARGEPVAGALVVVKAADPAAAAAALASPEKLMRRATRGVGQMRDAGFGDMLAQDYDALGRARTDEKGQARIVGLAAGDVRVVARHGGHADADAGPIAVAESGTFEVTLVLVEGGSVEVTVLDPDRTAVAGAEARIDGPIGDLQRPNESQRTVRTGAGGSAVAEHLAPGTYAATLLAKSEPMSFGGMKIPIAVPATIDATRTELVVREGEVTKVTLVQPLRASVGGRVTDASGPVAGVEVQLGAADGPEGGVYGPFGGGKRGTSDELGKYRVDGVLPGKYVVRFGRKGAPVKHEDELVVEAGRREVEKDLVLRGGTVRLVVVGAGDGLPAPKVRAELRPADAGAKGEKEREMTRMMSGALSGAGLPDEMQKAFGGADGSVQSDGEGKVAFGDVPPGRYEVLLEGPRHAPRTLPAFELGADASVDLGKVEVRAGGTITGEVKSASGEGTFMAFVQFAPAGANPVWQRVPAFMGRFKTSGLAPGKYRARACDPTKGADDDHAPGGPEVEVEVRPGEASRVTLVLPR